MFKYGFFMMMVISGLSVSATHQIDQQDMSCRIELNKKLETEVALYIKEHKKWGTLHDISHKDMIDFLVIKKGFNLEEAQRASFYTTFNDELINVFGPVNNGSRKQ